MYFVRGRELLPYPEFMGEFIDELMGAFMGEFMGGFVGPRFQFV